MSARTCARVRVTARRSAVLYAAPRRESYITQREDAMIFPSRAVDAILSRRRDGTRSSSPRGVPGETRPRGVGQESSSGPHVSRPHALPIAGTYSRCVSRVRSTCGRARFERGARQRESVPFTLDNFVTHAGSSSVSYAIRVPTPSSHRPILSTDDGGIASRSVRAPLRFASRRALRRLAEFSFEAAKIARRRYLSPRTMRSTHGRA